MNAWVWCVRNKGMKTVGEGGRSGGRAKGEDTAEYIQRH